MVRCWNVSIACTIPTELFKQKIYSKRSIISLYACWYDNYYDQQLESLRLEVGREDFYLRRLDISIMDRKCNVLHLKTIQTVVTTFAADITPNI